jgi:dTDP-4-amino-4,6-dideoxygalactose transaminase
LGYSSGCRTGMFGLGSFYSFASSKCLSAGGGGLAAINDPLLATRVRDLAAKLTSRGPVDSFRRATMQLARAALSSRALYGSIGNVLRSAAEDRGHLHSTVDTRAIAASSAAAVKALAALLPQRLFRQRQNSLQLLARLKHAEGVVLPVEPAEAVYAYTLFPVLLANETERDAIRQGMLEQSVDTSTLHHNCAEAAVGHGYTGGCPVSENVARRLLTLPNFSGLTDRDVDRVASAFLTALKRHRSTDPARRTTEAYA